MTTFLNKAKQTITQHNMFAPGNTVLLACSGGPDSVALLHVLLSLKDEFKIKLLIAHLNHCLRGKESKQDELLVQKLAEEYKLPLIISSVDVKKTAKNERVSLEEAGRIERYRFLLKQAKKNKADKIAIGHNQDDRIETFLIRLVRGAGPQGLSSIPYIRKEAGIFLVRPLLDSSRDDIEKHLKNNQLKYRIDSSNKSEKFLRNKIRLNLIPLLERKYNKGIKANIIKVVDNLALYRGFITDEINKCFKKIVSFQEGKVFINIKKLWQVPDYLGKEVIKKALYVFVNDVNFKNIDDVLKLARVSASGKEISVGDNIVALKQYQHIALFKKKLKEISAKKEIMIPGDTVFKSLKLKIRVEVTKLKGKLDVPASVDKLSKLGEEGPIITQGYFDYDNLANVKLFIRTKKEGDIFKPLGLLHKKKVKNIFIDEKLPKMLRDKLPLIVTDKDEIIWIAGYRIGEDFKVTEKTNKILKLVLDFRL